jgi:polysaccharide export outer membrane protein
VDPAGQIALPMLKRPIKAAGLLPVQLAKAIATALKDEELLVEPIVAVTIAEYHSRPVSVVGAVKRPVTFQAAGPLTLLEAISRAEGLTPDAGPEIVVSQPVEGRAEPIVRRISVRALIDNAAPELNFRLLGGEEVRVPEARKVYVVGNVKRPGSFAVREGPDTSVLKVLALAEGLMPFARKIAYIYRPSADGLSKKEIPIELEKIMQRKTPDVSLQPEDMLYIPDNKGRRMTVGALEKLAGFGAATASGVLIWRR